jgi:hypothetical protein
VAYKKIEYGFSFADTAIPVQSDKNRNHMFLRQVETVIDWQSIENLLLKFYQTGKSKAMEKAYPPLLLFKYLCILLQFHPHGLSINQGIAVDARLVKSASRPVSKEQLKEIKKQAETPEGKLDKKGSPKKFSRDLDSDWTVKNDKPHFGLKEHSSVDTENGFILSTYLSPSSQNDSIHLPMVVISSMHTADKIQTV